MHQAEESDLVGRVALQDLLDADEVLQTLRHLRAGDLQTAAVEEVVDPVGRVGVRLTLKK
jgi:hypothetical protein